MKKACYLGPVSAPFAKKEEESDGRRDWDGGRDAGEGGRGASERYEKGKGAKRLQADVSGPSSLYIPFLTLTISQFRSCGCYQIMSAIKPFSWLHKAKYA